jgi:hypothetical protein
MRPPGCAGTRPDRDPPGVPFGGMVARAPSPLPDDLGAWIAHGQPGMLCTANREGCPTTTRVWAAAIEDAGHSLRISILASDADRTLQNLAENPSAAVTLASPTTYRSLQLKGRCTPSAERRLSDARIRASLEHVSANCLIVGMLEQAPFRMMKHYDAPDRLIELRLEIEATFDQTPRPGAGGPL